MHEFKTYFISIYTLFIFLFSLVTYLISIKYTYIFSIETVFFSIVLFFQPKSVFLVALICVFLSVFIWLKSTIWSLFTKEGKKKTIRKTNDWPEHVDQYTLDNGKKILTLIKANGNQCYSFFRTKVKCLSTVTHMGHTKIHLFCNDFFSPNNLLVIKH